MEKKIEMQLRKNIRQRGDSVSPKLFTATLHSSLQKIDWEEGGIEVWEDILTHLKCADDLMLFAQDMDELQTTLEKTNKACLKAGLKINKKKTMTMCNGFVEELLPNDRHVRFSERHIQGEKQARLCYFSRKLHTIHKHLYTFFVNKY